ncbi:hypothetical protein [Actinoplanes couchii]|uniref:C2H2-type domain-containing protein n=1 Tax=Actinoplanes couchii TaxID=403638 RepID=A0ABQ3XU03_9ACTN|nr:hypothetical protein [Actinoplanes couchii]MDR6321981.1 hypothetical protein [Actinoplanes couchii]GID61993.1 hypothetical protein Aco03nite_103970 [Actinoplanes couchii]
MNIHITQDLTPTCPCGAQLAAGNPVLCRKCTNRARWARRHQPHGSHTGTDRGLRSRRNRNGRRGGDA